MFDQVFFGLTAFASLVLAAALLWRYRRRKHIHGLLWAIAALVFFVAAALLALGGLGVLDEPYVPVAAAFIPAFFADGVLFAAFKKRTYGTYYLAYVVAMIVVLALSKALNLAAIASFVLIAIHAPSGLIIFLLPLIMVFTKRASMSGSLVGIGGLLIGIGGMALATLETRIPLLSAAFLLEIIAPLLFLVALLFTVGILATPGWGFRETG